MQDDEQKASRQHVIEQVLEAFVTEISAVFPPGAYVTIVVRHPDMPGERAIGSCDPDWDVLGKMLTKARQESAKEAKEDVESKE